MSGNVVHVHERVSPVTDENVVFPVMNLPYEIRQNIWGFAVVKPGSFIGQLDESGVACAHGGFITENTASLHTSLGRVQFPACCRYPTHKEDQLCKDLNEYYAPLASTCSMVKAEITKIFFRKNGFELCDAQQMVSFVTMIGRQNIHLIRKLRLICNLDLKVEHFDHMFTGNGSSHDALYQVLATEYLTDDDANAGIVYVVYHLKYLNNLRSFDLAYRFNAPGHMFPPTSLWSGDSLQIEMEVSNVLEKVRQNSSTEESNEVVVVGEKSFSANLPAKEFALNSDVGRHFFPTFHSAMHCACIDHAEDCVEQAKELADSTMTVSL